MIFSRVQFLYTTFLIVLQFYLIEAHLLRHQLRHAQIHHSNPHLHLLELRDTNPSSNETTENTPNTIIESNKKDIEDTPNAQTGSKKETFGDFPKVETGSGKEAIEDVPTVETGSGKETVKDAPKAENESNKDSSDSTPKAHTGSKKESGNCQFPSDAGLIAITPHAKNAGWAMSPDRNCSPGSYCPYACPSGQVMAQWNPDAKAYTYPQSMDGGLYCDHDGSIKKPFPEKPYCVSGTGGVGAHNKIGKGVAFCQTVLPGSEAMLIPTHVEDSTDLAVPGTNYWCNTAAHYYINPPGIGVEEACVWGNESKPVGNWSPYVAGANTDQSGKTFVKVGWNPIYTTSALSSSPPNFGVKITCEKGDCNGTPCSIDPSVNGVGAVQSANSATGAGGANFCVVTVPKGSKANIEVFKSSKDHDVKEVEPSEPLQSQPTTSNTSEAEPLVKEKTPKSEGETTSAPVSQATPNSEKELEESPEKSPDVQQNSNSLQAEKLEPVDNKETSFVSSANAKPEESLNLQASVASGGNPTLDSTKSVPPTFRPNHLFNEVPAGNSPTAAAAHHASQNKTSSSSSLSDDDSEVTSLNAAGVEHTAALASHAIPGTAVQASFALSKTDMLNWSLFKFLFILIILYNIPL